MESYELLEVRKLKQRRDIYTHIVDVSYIIKLIIFLKFNLSIDV
jgi:hypothetical protein